MVRQAAALGEPEIFFCGFGIWVLYTSTNLNTFAAFEKSSLLSSRDWLISLCLKVRLPAVVNFDQDLKVRKSAFVELQVGKRIGTPQ